MKPKTYGVDYVHHEVAAMMATWDLIDACIQGEPAVKALGTAVLPQPNAHDTSPANMERYEAYLRRASYYNVTGRTLQGMVGYVFVKDPVAELPESLKSMHTNIDGAGVTLPQQAKDCLRHVLSKGRAGLLVDYPVTNDVTTQQQVKDGAIAPTITLYRAQDIINYRIKHENTKTVLTLLVLREQVFEAAESGEYGSDCHTQYRVYRNDGGFVTCEVIRIRTVRGKEKEVSQGLRTLLDKDAQPLKVIPFQFVGAANNDHNIDDPPIADLAWLNLAHFRNSADYEESAFIVGQPTPFFAGLSKQWVDEVLKGQIEIGARAAVLLPIGGTAGLLQATPNSLPKEAMELKERQMVAIGAKLVEQKKVQRTATEAGQEHASEASTLVTAANNVCLAYTLALNFALGFVRGTALKEITFELAESLTKESIDAPQAVAIAELWTRGVLGYEEIRWKFKQAGLAWLEDDIVKKEGEERLAAEAEREAATAKKDASREEIKKPPLKKKP